MINKAAVWTMAVLAMASTLLVPASAAGSQIGEGVLVDPKAGRVYVMSPDNAVEALRASDGKVLWRSNLAAKPLALDVGVLVAQAEPEPGERMLRIALLTPDQGERKSTSSATLPEGVEVRIHDGLGSRFKVRASTAAANVFISWEYHVMPMRGMPMPADEAAKETPPDTPSEPKKTEGTLRLNLQTGAVAPVHKSAVPRNARSVSSMVLLAPPGEPPNPLQRLSADGRHLIRSRLLANDNVFEKYEWTIIVVASNQVVGRLRSHLSHASFVVTGSRIVFETGPYERRTNGTMMAEPMKVRAVDLDTGREAWSRAVRDTVYRGPFPP